MAHLQIIVLFVVLVLHDALRASFSQTMDAPSLPGWAVWLASLGPMVVLAALTALVVSISAREVDRRGSMRAANAADRMLAISRWLALFLHASAVLVMGLLEQVRSLVGNVIALDEFITIVPPLGVFLAGWWAYYPVERAFRERVTLRLLDEGQPVFDLPTRGQFVLLNFRHQVLLSLVPIAMISIWSESAERILRWVGSQTHLPGRAGQVARWVADHQLLGPVSTIVQLLGVAAVFALSPLVLRRVWDTVRLSPGPLRSRLAAICDRAGVKVRDVLIWQTYGTMLNGAVIGLTGSLRYILLTDALLANLSARQVEAVMAHEVGHARHRHMPWLVLAMLVGIAGATVLVSVAGWAGLQLLAGAGEHRLAHMLDQSLLMQAGLAISALGLGLVWFGFVSRRFEWQADAFAVKQLTYTPPASTLGTPPEPTLWDAASATERIAQPADTLLEPRRVPDRASPEAVAAMVGALGSVAQLNHMEAGRPSWRHGSISNRQHRLKLIIGEPLDQLSIDRHVRWLKRFIALALVGILTMSLTSGGGGESTRAEVTSPHR